MTPTCPRPARSLGRAVVLLLLSAGCSSSAGVGSPAPLADAPAAGTQLFTRLPSSVTGVRFENRLTDSPELNVFTYRNYYNGGGVAIADLTGDGLPELVLTSNQGGPKLYLNEGKFHFRDVTEASGLRTRSGSWTTGVTIADVNGDGKLDIYVSKAGPGEPGLRANELWINQGLNRDGIPTFREMAKEYGVADEGYTTQAVFFDYDGDGDLDLLVVNNSPKPASSFGLRNTRNVTDRFGGAKLYRNDGGHFTDVTQAAGIHSPEMAFGLGVVVSDVNNDGRPDIYVSNDFFERDYLYINRGNGTFTDSLDRQMPVISYFSMGLDIADLDNDGWPDVYTTDMLPEDERRLKTTSQFEGWDVYQTKVRNGYHHQLMRNMLQRNNRDGTFSDVGQMAGVARTDWSWSALIADFDLDGRKDIFVGNGIVRDITSQDYIAFLANEETMKAATNGGRAKVDFQRLIKAMTSTPISSYLFHNLGGLHFENEAKAWGLDTPGFASGAAYGDLDGDGAPDLVVNRTDGEALVYRNNARVLHPDNHFLRVRLEGVGGNRFGVGARVTAFPGDGLVMQEESPTRGFQSSVDYVLDFGLGAHARVDSLRVDWPDGRVSRRTGLAADQLVTVRQADAVVEARRPTGPRTQPLLTDISSPAILDFAHHENDFVDFDRDRMIPKLLSREGPTVAVGDVNGDGLDDLYIGGAKDQAGRLFVQRKDGSFEPRDDAVFAQDAVSEDVGAVFFDADGDGHPDLYVVSGGNEFSEGAPALQDRLYLNDGHGHFHRAPAALPAEAASGSRVAAADYDGDGSIDLFVGGRLEVGRYGIAPRSMLLKNDGHGHFTDVTARLAPGLERVGMVTDAVWRDVDGDGRLDLVVVGEWMPITIFRNLGGGRLARLRVPGLERSHGWWNRIVAGDFSGHGRVDFVVGNLGLNSRIHASDREPALMYVKDFDNNGTVDQILTSYNQGVSYPLLLRDDLLRSLPFLKPRFRSYADYAQKTMTQIFSPAELAGAVVDTAFTFATTLVRNNGDGSFTMVPLPDEAQVAPVYGILAADVDGDARTDLLLAGNFEGFRPDIGAMRTGRGLLLHGERTGAFTPVPSTESGFVVTGDARDIQRIRSADGERYIVARNDDRPLLFRRTSPIVGMQGRAPRTPRAPSARSSR